MPNGLEPMTYLESFHTGCVNKHGQIRWPSSQYFVSETIRGQAVGLKFNHAGSWNIYGGPALLAQLDDREGVTRRLRRKRKK